MNIHSSLVMADYIMSRDGVGDGSGLIIKSSFNCILPHYHDVTESARLPLSLHTVCVHVCVSEGVELEMWGVQTLGHWGFISRYPSQFRDWNSGCFLGVFCRFQDCSG